MLKNEELRQISKAHTILGMIWAYTIELENNEFYEETGVTTKDIHDCMIALNHICITQKLKKLQVSDYSNEYKKQHRKHANIIQNINNAKRRNDTKKYNYWIEKLKEEN